MSVLILNYDPSGLYKRNEVLNCLLLAALLKRHSISYKIKEISSISDEVVNDERFVVITSREKKVQELALKIKKRDKTKVLIFFHEYFSFFINKDFLKIVDLVVVGNGFNAIIDLIKDLKRKETGIKSTAWLSNGVVNINSSQNPIDLKKVGKLPYSKYPGCGIYKEAAFKDSPYEEGKDAALIFFSRGCKSRCSFCINPIFYKRKVYYRDPFDVLEDIDFFIEKGIVHFSFEDENLIADRKRFNELYTHIKKKNIMYRCHGAIRDIDNSILKKLFESGCKRLDIGIETASLDLQSKINKINGVKRVIKVCNQVKSFGIRPFILMMLGFPGETREDLLKTKGFLEILEKNGMEFGLSLFRPLPGTCFEKIKGITETGFSSHGKDVLHYIGDETDVDEIKRIYKRFTSKKLIIPNESKSIKVVRNGSSFIRADEYFEADFKPVPLNIWNGDKWDSKGFAHLVGRFKGYIKYRFSSSESFKANIKIRFRACTQTDEKGNLVITINENKKEVYIPEKSESGEILCVEFENITVDIKNELCILCNSEMGLSLFLSFDDSKVDNKSIEISTCDVL